MEAKDIKVHKFLNICMLVFVITLMSVALVTFFVVTFNNSDFNSAYSIASIYILCMLLVTASLKTFLDKTCSTRLKVANIIGITAIFVSILIVVVFVCLSFAFPKAFTCL